MTKDELKVHLQHPNVQAFLVALRLGEGTSDEQGYQRIVGGDLFEDFSAHPNQRVWIPRYNVYSTAAGAYQILKRTWDEMVEAYGLTDFSPENQDLAAVGLVNRRQALQDVLAGRLWEAINKCNKEWASLPGSPYGQRTEALDRVTEVYKANGGTVV